MVSTKLLKPARREYEPCFPNLSSSLGFGKQAVREFRMVHVRFPSQISKNTCENENETWTWTSGKRFRTWKSSKIH